MNRHFDWAAGVDLSMTSTGVAIVAAPHMNANPRWELQRVKSSPELFNDGPPDRKGKSTATFKSRYCRMENIADRIAAIVPDKSLVFIEGPSYGSTGAGTFDRAGLWWLVYETLALSKHCDVAVVAPSQRMLYATGSGRADKDAVLAAVVARYRHLSVTGNDVADAVVFAAMAARAAGWPVEPDGVPKKNLAALDKLAGQLQAIEEAGGHGSI